MGSTAKKMLKVGSGVIAPIAARVFRCVAMAFAVLWPFAILLLVNFKIALAVGVPYAALAGAVVCRRKGWR